jgi:hypothetical protein
MVGVYGGFLDQIPMGSAINRGLTFRMAPKCALTARSLLIDGERAHRGIARRYQIRFLPRPFGPQFFLKGLTECNVIVHHVGRDLAVLKEG